MKQPQRLPLDKIYSVLPEAERMNRKQLSFRDGIGVAIGINGLFFRHLGELGTPYLLEDYRMGMVVRGELRGIINLQEYHIPEGSIIFVTPGTIVEPIEASDDFLLEGLGMSADKFLLAHGGKLPDLFSGQMRDGRRAVSEESRGLLDRMFRLLLDMRTVSEVSDGTICSMVSAITNYYDQLFHEEAPVASPSHTYELFNRFIRLVNLYGRREHQLAFYAEKLCITSRYLGTLVQNVSGTGAKEWIDRAIISSAKVMLRHSDKQVVEIANELNFPNVSFFCKYFKRLTGLTPQQYRKGNENRKK